MKSLRFMLFFLAMLGLASLALSTGCGSAAPIPPAEVPAPIGVSMLDGGNNIPVDSSFKYTFSQDVLTQTVNTSTFFIVKNEAQASMNKADLDESICDPSQAIDAVVSCSSNTECSLVPTVNLEYDSSYTICLTTGIRYFDGSPFEGIMATFTTEVDGPLSLNDLDGATGVPIASEFRYRFQQEVESATADDSTFFIVSLGASASLNKADVVPSICVAANALDAQISCTDWSCTLSPVDVLEYGTSYAACLTGDIDYEPVTQTVGQLQIQSQAEFDGFMASFGTEEAPITPTEVTITSAKLVRLDGTELELEHRPIPRAINIKYALSAALPTEEERLQFESAVTLVDELAATVDGSYEWAGDFLSVVFTPTWPLEYRTEYSIVVDTGSLPIVSLSKANGDEMSFTTMTEKDVNGDGFSDVIVGASGYESGVAKGQAYIFLSSATGIDDCDLSGMTCVADTTITGGADADALGLRVAIAGDLNADGFEDIALGAAGYDGNRGQAYILHGSALGIDNCDLSANPPCLPDAIISGENPGDTFGYDLSGVSDVNGDGYDDLAIGASNYYPGNAEGRAYIFLGSVSGIDDCDLQTCSADATITGETTNDQLGISISSAGDVNADGYDDVIIGAPHHAVSLAQQGSAYLFLGSPEGIHDCDLSSCTPDAMITGSAQWDLLGVAVSTAGDVNGDGYDDIMISSLGYPSLNQNGIAYIFLGSASAISSCDLSVPGCTPDTEIIGEGFQNWLGHSVSSAGDVNADGYDDIIIGANLYSDTLAQRGRAYFFLGSSGGIGNCDLRPPSTCEPNATITGAHVGDGLGQAASAAGDVNGDGYDDIILSAEAYLTYSRQGQVYIFLGSGEGMDDCNLSTCTADTTLTGEHDNDKFGDSID